MEEVREGAGEGCCDSIFGGTPLPKHLGQVSGNCCGVASQTGTHLLISSLDGLDMTTVLVRLI